VRPGVDLAAADFRLPEYGTVAGKVLVRNQEPVGTATVSLVARE